MFSNKFLSLNGFAYLHDVRRYQKGQRLITLKLINDDVSDDIWVECQTDLNDFPVLAQLEYLLAMEKSVILKFEAKYSRFRECFRGLAENDPANIVQLQCSLIRIYEHFVEKDICPDWHGHSLESGTQSVELGA